jgi:hypothetical protein
VGWWMPYSTDFWSHLETKFSKFFIYNHSYHFPIFLSLIPLTPPKWISKLLEKINFIFDFSQILELCFLFLFFHIHFLQPISHHLNKSHDLQFVFRSSGIQNKKPLFTVYPLYTHVLRLKLSVLVKINDTINFDTTQGLVNKFKISKNDGN